MRFDQARINKIIYNQKDKEPVTVTDIYADDLTWVGTKLDIGKASLNYGDMVDVTELKGSINLTDSYPLDLSTVVTVHNLEQAYIDPIEIEATGSLKRTYGKLRSKYNNSKVNGEFTVQGMDANTPLSAKLFWDEVSIPYAEGLDIRLQQGLATVSGVLSDLELRINSQLLANNIPSGLYQGRANIVDFGALHVQRLKAHTPDGDLLAKGILDWQNDFNIKAMLYSNDYQVAALLPEEAQPAADFVPKYLDGKLAFLFDLKNKDGLMQIQANLQQKDGETLKAKVVQGETPRNPRFSAPWYIDASWQNLKRQNTPQVGNINSPYGVVDVQLRDNKLWVKADAQIAELNAAPAGDYKLSLNKIDDRINLSVIDYKGVMGDLSGKGSVLLASKSSPLSWEITANTRELKPQALSENIPVSKLAGHLEASGKILDITQRIKGKTVSGQRHVFTLKAADLDSQLTAQVVVPDTKVADLQSGQTIETQSQRTEARYVKVVGSGDGSVDLFDGEVQHFDARFNGQVASQGLPNGELKVDVNGALNNINIKHISHKGDAGSLLASGNVNLIDGIKWNVRANTQEFNVGFFVPQTQGIVTGDLTSSGHWRDNQTQLGDLRAFDVKFDGAIDTPQLPKGKLMLDAGGNAQSINVRNFSHIGEAGSLVAKGNVTVKNGVSWDINAVMEEFNLGYFVSDVPSNITGRVSSTGAWKDSVQQVNISQMALRGQLDGRPLSTQGSLKTTLHLPKNMDQYLTRLKTEETSNQVATIKSIVDTLNINNLLLRWGDNEVLANGNIENLQAKVNIRDLTQVGSEFSGNILGGLTLVQPKGQALPTIYVDLESKQLRLPGVYLANGSVKGKIVDLAKRPSVLVVMVEGMEAAQSKIANIQATFNGTEQSHTLTVKADTVSAGTDVALQAVVKGSLDRQAQSWQGVIGNGRIATKHMTLAQSQPAQLNASFANDKPKLQLAAHCWQATNQEGKICLRENLVAAADQGQVNLAIQDIDTTLFAPFLPKELSWKSTLNGKAVMAWGKGVDPTINATLYTDNGQIGMQQDSYLDPVSLPYKRISLIVRSIANGVQIRTDINSGQGARGYADIVVDPYKEQKPISGALVLNEFHLAVLKPFFPGMRQLGGNITMAGGLGGTLSKPVFYGDVDLKDATVAMLDLPVNLTSINAKARIRGQQAKIEGSFMSGEGKGDISGEVNWQQELQAMLRIKGEELDVTQPPLLFAKVNPDFHIIVKPQQQYVNIVGAITIPSATIRPPEANADVVTKSEDVVVLDRELVGNIDEVLAISKPWSINAEIGVDLGRDINFRGFGAVIPLAGALHLQQQGQGTMTALGVIQVSRRTRIDAFGQSLELNYGQIRFNGDVTNPRLSIEAAREIEGYDVGIRVKGNVAEPNITVFNEAGLTQQQAMNALVTGRISNAGATQISEEGFKSQVTHNLAAAGLSLGLSGANSLTNSIGDAFGLERLTIDASGSSDDTNVNVTGYITPDLYIRYGVGVFSAQNSLSLRYQLTRRIYIQATSSIENAVDVVYSFRF
ncbi:translocation/assembly module TamB domain-containing protein [Psychrobacter lutiphocae]|uniref:translocation/assembly module TamB domain-containing protein n=1 Tax=Psychrobacter lutiphocae TaxID=540500 RepID=UPI001D115BC9|nr:translocation/assembly module TamB domain-containing protein [Psychrobacter lutiphocae]